MKILIQQDNTVILKALELSRKRGGYAIICSADTLEAMVKLELISEPFNINSLPSPIRRLTNAAVTA
jgi:hypothetical protein